MARELFAPIPTKLSSQRLRWRLPCLPSTFWATVCATRSIRACGEHSKDRFPICFEYPNEREIEQDRVTLCRADLKGDKICKRRGVGSDEHQDCLTCRQRGLTY